MAAAMTRTSVRGVRARSGGDCQNAECGGAPYYHVVPSSSCATTHGRNAYVDPSG